MRSGRNRIGNYVGEGAGKIYYDALPEFAATDKSFKLLRDLSAENELDEWMQSEFFPQRNSWICPECLVCHYGNTCDRYTIWNHMPDRMA